MLWSAFGLPMLQFCSLLSIINRAGDDSSSARLGLTGCSSTRGSSRLRGSSGGGELFKTPERQLSAGSGPSAGALLPFHCTCELVQDRLSGGGQPRLHSLLFTAEGPRLQEGRKGGRKSARRDGKCSPSRAERSFQYRLKHYGSLHAFAQRPSAGIWSLTPADLK